MPPEKARRLAAWGFWGFVVLGMFTDTGQRAPALLMIVQVFVMTFTAFAWVHFDAKLRGRHLGRLMRMGIVALAAVFVPVYVIRSRGSVGALKSFGKFFGILLLLSVISVVVLSLTGRPI